MTVGWLLNIFGDDTRNDNKIQYPPRPMESSFSKPPTLFPILTGNGGFPPSLSNDYPLSPPIPAPPPPPPPPSTKQRPEDSLQGFNPFFKDGLSQELQLPMLEPDYPAFFIIILLVTLTSFAMFVLLFLCCLDGDDLLPQSGILRTLHGEELGAEPEVEPPFKEVGTETESNFDTAEEPPAEEDDVEVVEADASADADADADDTEVVEAAEEDLAAEIVEGEEEEAPPPAEDEGDSTESDADTVIEVIPPVVAEDLTAVTAIDDRIHVLSLNVYIDNQSDPDLQQYKIIQDYNSKSMVRAYDYVNVNFNNQQSISN